MKKQPNESAAAGEDLISDLPDEILHSVLRRIPYFKEAAQTSALSSRWRNLWSSYPVVELDSATSPYYTSHSASPFYPLCRFYSTTSEGFYSFHNATMTKFSRDKLLRIETLKLSVCTYFPFPRSPAIEQLLDLASERKAENIEIKEIEIVALALQTLHIQDMDQVFRIELMAPQLSILKTDACDKLRLDVNSELKFLTLCRSCRDLVLPLNSTLKISGCFHLKEIEITAYELRSLHLEGRVDSKHWKNELLKIELTAPQLNVLEITNFDLKMDDLEVMVSKFQSLKSLSLDRCCTTEKRPILSDRELEEFTSSALSGWEKIELDADPWLEKVALRRDA
ncbi:FBD-associated F-box protein At5g22730 [Linum perenne]